MNKAAKYLALEFVRVVCDEWDDSIVCCVVADTNELAEEYARKQYGHRLAGRPYVKTIRKIEVA